MRNLAVIESKISYLQKHLANTKSYQKHSLRDIQDDEVLQSAIERELYVIAQAVIDLAEAVVAFKEFRKPTTMREAIDILGEQGILPSDFVAQFINIVGFRNALAHDYEDLKLEVVYDVLVNKLSQVEAFVEYIKKMENPR